MLFSAKQRRMAFCGLLCIFSLVAACPAPAFANPPETAVIVEPGGPLKPDDELSIGVGGRMSVTPYKEYDTQWTPFPIVSYEGKYAYIRGFTAGVKMVNLEFLEVSVFAGYDGTSFDSSESSNKRVRKLSDRYSSAVAGLEVRLLTHYGMLHASVAQDVLGHSKGQNGTVGYMQSVEFGDLELIPAVGFQWSSSRYNDYYYGIRGGESRKSGLDAYDASAGISSYVGLSIDYSVTEAWEIFCNGELVFLDSTIKDSPMVDRSNTYNLMLGFSYTF